MSDKKTEQTITKMIWEASRPPLSQLSVMNSNNKFATTRFHFPQENGSVTSRDLYFPSEQATWAHALASHLFVGQIAAAYGGLSTSEPTGEPLPKFTKYDLIIDASNGGINPKKTSPIGISVKIPTDIKLVQFDIDDDGKSFHKMKDFFEQNDLMNQIDSTLALGKKVLINCANGEFRSSMIACFYLMTKYKVSAIDALWFVISKRPCLKIRPGDLSALLEYEKSFSLTQTVQPDIGPFDINPSLFKDMVAQDQFVKITFTHNTAQALNTAAHALIRFVTFLQTHQIPFEMQQGEDKYAAVFQFSKKDFQNDFFQKHLPHLCEDLLRQEIEREEAKVFNHYFSLFKPESNKDESVSDQHTFSL